MKESTRAARDEIAHMRCVAALKELAGEDDEKVKELEEVRMRRMSAPVGMMVEREIMADILEGLAENNNEPMNADLSFLSEEQVHALSESGYDTLPAISDATDEELEAVPHVGKATVEKIREAFASDSAG